MEKTSNPIDFKSAADSIRGRAEPGITVTVYKFDLFKGTKDPQGKILKIKSVGSAYIREGLRTYTVHLKALLKDSFYLLPNSRPTITDADFVILTREPSQTSGRKYFWNNVGEGRVLQGENHGLMELVWDIFSSDLYMTLEPLNVSSLPEEVKLAAEAA